MRLLLDENLPKRLKLDFPDHEIFTVHDMDWKGIKFLFTALHFLNIKEWSSQRPAAEPLNVIRAKMRKCSKRCRAPEQFLGLKRT